jgi:lipid II isoglutaminyl synthase (glutamine-hydrolysing)
MAAAALRVCWLYPDRLSINGDLGNVLALRRRCEWRGIGVRVATAGLTEPLGGPHDIVYLGGGQDVDQRRCAADLLATKADDLRAAVAAETVVLGVAGGFQLLGRSVDTGGVDVPGLALVDAVTTRGGGRLAGDTVVDVDLGAGPRVLAGYEHHAGRTVLGAGTEPLGQVRAGPGNDGRSGQEGVRCGNIIGTYLRGPLLLANAWFADELIARALGVDALEPLDDALEDDVHRWFAGRGAA